MSVDPKMMAQIADIHTRRIEAFRKADGRQPARDILEAVEEGTTEFDIDTLSSIRRSLDPDVQAIIDLYVEVWSGFARGFRCGVCGRTSAQSAAIGYDCTNEC